jgi:type VI secretion system secreted protein VgrG
MGSASQFGGMGRRFSFAAVNEADINAAFEVVRFEGEEAISTLYRFELLLISRNSDIDETKVISHQATFTLSDGVEGKAPATYVGLVQEFAQLHQVASGTFYRAVLVPKLWKLDAFFLSEVYLNKKRPEIFKLIMDNAGLTADNYTVKFKNDGKDDQGNELPVLPYICQYQESYLNFISRWAERLGTYWWYEAENINGSAYEKVVFSDVNTAHPAHEWELQYQPDVGANPGSRNLLRSLTLETRVMPLQLTIMDYQHYRADNGIKGSVPVDAINGIGEVFLYGENLTSNTQAEEVAKVRAEAILCRNRQYQGKTTATGLRCGYTVQVNGHYRTSFNRGYMVTRIQHRGSQTGLLLEGRQSALESDNISDDFYQAEFTAIPDNVQFRSEINHPWPKIHGTVNAFIDAEGSGEYAELNEKGEYKIQVPFAVTGKPDAHGSAWIRRATIYAGEEHGIYFPLHKGTEVLLSFVNGNPDQPVIMMAAPNSIKNCLLSNKNQTQALIRTAGNNFIGMEDLKGKQGLLIESPTARTMIRLGDKDALSTALPEATASNANGLSAFTEDNITLDAGKNIEIKAKDRISITSETGDINITSDQKLKTTSKSETTTILGPEFSFTLGAKNTCALSQTFAVTFGAAENIFGGGKFDFFAGLATTIAVAGQFNNWLGVKTDIGAGLQIGINAGIQMSVYAGLKIEAQKGYKIVRGGLTEIAKKEVVVENTDTSLVDNAVKVAEEDVSAIKRSVSLENSILSQIKETVAIKASSVTLHDGPQIFTGG